MKKIKEPPVNETPNIIITSLYGSEEDTAKAEIDLYGSTNIRPKKNIVTPSKSAT